MSPGEEPHLGKALAEGNTIFWALAKGVDADVDGLDGARDFLFRRWVFEALLVLRIQGPSRYNDMALALGSPRGQSLSPKLAALRERGLVTRSPNAGGPLRVVYGLTTGGRRLADSVYTLTRWKGLLSRAAHDAASPLPAFENLPRSPPAAPGDGSAALDRYVEATAAIAEAREAVCRPREFEDGLVTARRFCRAWVHKWHSQVLRTLAVEGPQRFSDLRARLGVGNEALTKVLVALSDANSIELTSGSAGKRYSVGRFGWADLSLGAPLTLLLLQASANSEAAPRRSTKSD
jgi:DNA-binding HxlR family transcriptional regulator